MLAIAGTGLIGTATMAMAAAASGTPTSAGTNAQLQTGDFSYACNFAGYGGGATPIDVATTLTVPDSVSLDSHSPVTLTTQAIALPAAVSQDLPALDSIQVDATAATVGTNEAALGFQASSGPVAAGAAQIPAIMVGSDPLTFNKLGNASIAQPSSLTLTPFAGGRALAAISCTPTGVLTTSSLLIAVTTPPGTVVGNYLCGAPIGEPSTAYQIAVGLTVSGSRRVGATDSVTLTVPATAGTSGAGSPTVDLKGSVPVSGAQHGSIAVAGPDSRTASVLRATGKLVLTAAGTDHILLPTGFQIIDPSDGPTFAIFFCTLSGTQDPAGTQLTVSAAVPATASATPVASATPAGAPATGGGPGPGSDVALAIAGALSLAAGTAMVLMAFLRRKAHQSVV